MTTIRCPLAEAAAISRHQAAILQGERIILFSEWDEMATRAAQRLRDGGVRPGARVALFLATDWRAVVLFTAVIRVGAVACPLSTRLPRARVIEQAHAVAAERLIAYLSGEDNEDLVGLTVLNPDGLLAPGTVEPVVPEIDLDAPAIMLFTSGTSGPPRPAVLSYGNLYYNARGANTNLRLHSQDRWLLNLPLYHVSGLGILMRCLLSGAALMIPDAREDLYTAIAGGRPSHVSLVPAQLHELLHHAEPQALEAVRVMLVGGSACPEETLRQARALRWPVYLTYGLTEMASQVTTVPPDAPPERRTGGAGRVLRHRSVRINAGGEIEVAGPCLFLGYWRDGRIERELTDDGWFATGDLGSLDEAGYLTVRGRRDGLIISGGENIQPEEVEDILRAGGDIDDVVVVPVPHAKYGQRPVAFVRARVMDPAGWARRIAEKTAAFKIPDVFHPWPDDAPTVTMKPPRRWFRERAEALASPPRKADHPRG